MFVIMRPACCHYAAGLVEEANSSVSSCPARASDQDAVATAAQTLIILVDIPHTRMDALAAGAIVHLTKMLGPSADDGVTLTVRPREQHATLSRVQC